MSNLFITVFNSLGRGKGGGQICLPLNLTLKLQVVKLKFGTLIDYYYTLFFKKFSLELLRHRKWYCWQNWFMAI